MMSRAICRGGVIKSCVTKGKKEQLATKPPQRTLSELHFLQATHQDHPAITDLEHALRYLQQREEMIDYAHFRRMSLIVNA